MPKPLLCILLLLTTLAFSQERTLIYGSINAQGSIDQLHILNKNSGEGTITGNGGRFQIRVQLNDTLVVSGIQFYYQELIIDQADLKNKTVTIELLQKINELDEVTVRSHNLSGNLQTDANNVKDSVSKIGEGALNFSGIDFSLEHMGARDQMDRLIPPNPLGPSNGVPGFDPGANPLAILFMLLDPLKEPIGKIGATKRKNKKRKKSMERSLAVAPDQILIAFRSLIENDLKIPAAQVADFITYCGQKGLYELYLADKKIEMIDLFIREKTAYLKQE